MIYLFNNQEELIKILSSDSLMEVEQEQSLTDERYISNKLFVEARGLDDDLLAQVEYLAIQTIDNKQKFDLYFLLRYSHHDELTTLECVQSGIEELMKTPNYDIRPEGSVREHATKILEGSQWSVQYAPEVGTGQKFYYYQDAFTSLKKMCEFFNVEMQFHVEINHNRIGARYIEFKKRIGQATHKRVTYGHNALEIVKETQKDKIFTALIGRGRGEQVSKAGDEKDGKIQTQAGYSRKINFGEIEWSTAKGDPIDKPKGQQYIELKEATQQFGVVTPNGMKPKIGFVDFDTDDRNELIQRTYEVLPQYARPRVELKTKAVYLNANIGDTVRVVRHDLNIDYPVRVFEIKWDRLTNQAIELRLGDILHESPGKRQARAMSSIRSEIESQSGQLVNNLVDYVTSAGGFNMNYYSKTEPDNPRIGDTWFQPDPENEGEYILRMWNGTIWEEVIRTVNWNVVDNQIKQVEGSVQSLEDEINKLDRKNQNQMDNFKQQIADLDVPKDILEAMKKDIEHPSNSKFWSNIQKTISGRFEQFNTETVKTEIATTARGISREMKNLETGMQQNLSQTADALRVEFNDGLSDITATANGLSTRIGRLDSETQSTFRQIQSQIDLKVSKPDVESIISNSGDSIYLAVKDKIQATKMTGEEIASALNITRSGIKLKSSLIKLDGDTYMTNAFARNLVVEKLSSNDVSAFTGKFSNVIANNLDVNYISGNKADFIQALFNGRNSRVKIDPKGMQVLRSDGTYSTNFIENGLEIWREGIHIGSIHSLNANDSTGYYQGLKSMSITTQPDSYLSLAYYSMDDKRFNRALSLGGDGRLRLHSPFYAGDTNYGFEINQSRIESEQASTSVTTIDDVIFEGETGVEPGRGNIISVDLYNKKIPSYRVKQAKFVEVGGLRFTVKNITEGIYGYYDFEVEEKVEGNIGRIDVRILGTPRKVENVSEAQYIDGSGFRDVYSGGGVVIDSSKDTWVSSSSEGWISITSIYRDLVALKNSVDSLSKASGGGGWNAKGYEPSGWGTSYYKDTKSKGGKQNVTTKTATKIKVGDLVRIRRGVTTYYNSDYVRVGIAPGYESKTYVVSNIEPGRPGTHRISLNGTIIAWINEGDIYKV